MRRKDREITDFNEIVKVIDQCDIIRIGLADGDYPYIVPMNFAYVVEGETVSFYVHGAMAGRKYELMQQNKKCSFEMDIPLKLECIYEDKDATMRYESVMGTADIVFLDGDDRQKAIDDIIMNRYDETRNFDYNRDVVKRTAVAKITANTISGKRNPISGNAD